MRTLSTIAIVALLSGCGLFDRQAQAADGTTVTLEEFRGLQWLDGRWEGHAPDGTIFRETYEFVNDSTIRTRTWADTAYTQVSDSSELTLRHGQVTSGTGEHRWVLTKWDRSGMTFEPRGKAANGFTWRQVDAFTWTATLTWTDAEGKPQTRIYTMRRWQA